jgi:ABC-type methionine transport system ATPase subunit
MKERFFTNSALRQQDESANENQEITKYNSTKNSQTRAGLALVFNNGPLLSSVTVIQTVEQIFSLLL